MKDSKKGSVFKSIYSICLLCIFLLTQGCNFLPVGQSSSSLSALIVLFGGGASTSTGASATSKEISSFSVGGQTGVIGSNSIGLTLPFGSTLTGLVATFEHTGKGVIVGSTVQVSGTTTNNFSSPVVYTVIAENGTTKNYTVTVTIADGTAKDFISFSILGQAGTIGATSIGVTVPFGTNPTSLISTFTISGASVNIAGVNQVSATTVNDFTTAKIYTIVAANGTTKTYTVTVSIAANPAKDITSFSILGQVGTIGVNTIGVTLPFGTNPNNLVPTFTISGASININGTNQVSNTTANDFSSVLIYTVVAADGTSKNYNVTVVISANPAKDITAFSILGQAGTISASSVGVTVPFGTNPNNLVATFTISGASINIAGTNQVSATTANDFTTAKTYTVVAADGTSKNYTVTVVVAANPAKDITAFSILGQTGTIGANSVGLTLPYGTNINNLVATFTISGASVNIAGINQVSATTANDFTNAKTYTVVAANGTTKNYTVTVTIAANPAKDITAFSILGQAGIIGTNTIGVTVPFGTNPNNLVATFTISGASVNIAGSNQVSATTANDFTSALTYTVVAADTTTKTYTVSVTVAANPAKDITAFSILGQAGTIGTNTIGVIVPFGTNPNNLVATFTISGASVNIAGINQVSATTVNDFTTAKTYTVIAADSTSKSYTVTVTVAGNPAKDITAFSIMGQAGVISANSVGITLPSGTNPANLVASFTISGASVNIGGTNQVSASTANDFTSAKTYTIVAADGTTKNYTVTVTVLVNRSWASITSSADGVKLAAGGGSQIYTSIDSGVTWTQRSEGNGLWRCITSSSNGERLAAGNVGGNRGLLSVSNDSGVTWTAGTLLLGWRALASSSDGLKLAALDTFNRRIYTSTDGGSSWIERQSILSGGFSIASSSDGLKLAVGVPGDKIYLSNDGGVSWTARESNRSWYGISSSADGTKLAVVVYGGQIYTSTDSGVSWTARESNRSWYGISSSADGTKLVAVVQAGQIYTSTDSGVTWTARDANRNWGFVASSSDGVKLVAVVPGGHIYTSTDSGVTWQARF
jgi:hypothetical protein